MMMDYAAILLLGAGGLVSWSLNRWNKVSLCSAWFTAAVLLWDLVVSCSPFTLERCFQLPILAVGICAALYAPGYLKGHADGKEGIFWLFFDLTLASMLAVTLMRTLIPFIVAWEFMGIFSFALVAFDTESKAAQRASWIYLLACEAGGLLLMFLAALQQNHPLPGVTGLGVALAVGLVAFGLKAGFPLLHVWLPDAHPAAPAPVSAVMSAAMIPLGLYGLVRFVLVPQLRPAETCIFLILGVSGAFLGILFALVQKDLKRLLAYSSVENIGIMTMAWGLSFLGMCVGDEFMALAGGVGMIMHLLNHAALKSTLFLCAGSVLKSTGTLNMDQLGGLMKKMPATGTIFTICSLGISGLPPFCGFAGELLIYAAGFSGIGNANILVSVASLAVVTALAATGAVSACAFCKSIGAVFQGEPRTDSARNARPESRSMVFPLVLMCLLSLVLPVLEWLYLDSIPDGDSILPLLPLRDVTAILYKYVVISALFTGVLILLLAVRAVLRRKHPDESGPTWDCGYARPTARMEYTGSAFVQPLADQFNTLLGKRRKLQRPEGLFPEKAGIDEETDDFGERLLWRPLFRLFGGAAEWVHRFQSGYLHLYILIMVLALVLMLAWGFCVPHEYPPAASPVPATAQGGVQ